MAATTTSWCSARTSAATVCPLDALADQELLVERGLAPQQQQQQQQQQLMTALTPETLQQELQRRGIVKDDSGAYSSAAAMGAQMALARI